MTAQADVMRDERRRFAAPGGAHDRLVRFLDKALPAAIGLVVAVMILTPLGPRGEVSFLLDRNKASFADKRIQVDRASYRGTDNEGRQFDVTAASAVQESPSVPVVALRDLVARTVLQDGPARITAPSAQYDYQADTIGSREPLTMTAADGYQMRMSNVAINMKTRIASGAGGVSGTVPTGTFQADGVAADLGARTVALVGHARLRMVPGKLSMPR